MIEIGSKVEYRPVGLIECEPIMATVVDVKAYSTHTHYVIDVGPTRYAAPHDRELRTVESYQITEVE